MSQVKFIQVKDLVEQLKNEDQEAYVAIARCEKEDGDYALMRNEGWMNPGYMENKPGRQNDFVFDTEIEPDKAAEKGLVKVVVLYGTQETE